VTPILVSGAGSAVAGMSLGGSAASNYYIAGITPPQTLAANITPAPLTISGLVAKNKVYDGNTAAVVTGTPSIAGLLGSDASSLTGTVLSGTFATSQQGDNIVVTANLSTLTIGNTNYYIAGVTFPLMANIYSAVTPVVMPSITPQVTPAPVFKPTVPAKVQIDNRTPAATLVILHDIAEAKQDLLATFNADNVKYNIPGSVLVDTVLPETAKPRYVATLLNGDPLPNWLKVDPETKVLTSDNVPVSALPIRIKVKTLLDGKEIKDTILTVKAM
jgi:hypothetical protein